jgi:hypothetical protein
MLAGIEPLPENWLNDRLKGVGKSWSVKDAKIVDDIQD